MATVIYDRDGVQLTQYNRGRGLGMGVQLLVWNAAGYQYLTPRQAINLGAMLLQWGVDTQDTDTTDTTPRDMTPPWQMPTLPQPPQEKAG